MENWSPCTVPNGSKGGHSSTVIENHRKSLLQHCERSELRLHFEWTKIYKKMMNFLTKTHDVWKSQKKSHFYIVSEASYVYILSGQKFIKNAQKWSILAIFWKPEACGQTVLSDRSILIEKNWQKTPKLKLSNATYLVIFIHYRFLKVPKKLRFFAGLRSSHEPSYSRTTFGTCISGSRPEYFPCKPSFIHDFIITFIFLFFSSDVWNFRDTLSPL